MMAYVLAFLFQWWPMAVITSWSFIGEPHPGMMILAMVVTNLGPCYNALAYIYLRRQTINSKQREMERRTLNC